MHTNRLTRSMMAGVVKHPNTVRVINIQKLLNKIQKETVLQKPYSPSHISEPTSPMFKKYVLLSLRKKRIIIYRNLALTP